MSSPNNFIPFLPSRKPVINAKDNAVLLQTARQAQSKLGKKNNEDNMEKLDVVILGATGFSGKYIVRNMSKIDKGIKWGIAGRSTEKLKDLMDIVKNSGIELPSQSIFVCNAKDKDSLIEVCKRTKIIVNCIGPYMQTGHAVVEACIECSTHYLDITVEMHYILDITRKYHKLAEASNVLIIPACGFVAVVTVTGLMYLDDQFSGTLKSVELYTHVELPKEALYPNTKNCLLHAASLDTVMERIVNGKEFEILAKEMLPEIKLPSEMKRFPIHYHDGRMWVPYMFPDEAIANLSQKYLKETEGKPYIPFKIYNNSTFSFFYIIVIPLFCIFYVFSRFQWFRKLISKYPGVLTLGYVTHKGPDKEVAKKVKNCMILEGRGWNKDVKNFTLPENKFMKLKVTSYDGYQTTADSVAASILTLLEEAHSMPKGGVVNCGAAFRRTNIVQRLQNFGIKYDLIDK